MQIYYGKPSLQTKRREGGWQPGKKSAGTPPYCDFDKAESIFAIFKANHSKVSNIEQT
jgi:hypothetical protein